MAYTIRVVGFALSLSTIVTHAEDVPSNIKNAFGLFAIQNQMLHRFEGFELKGKSLEMNLWYEDSSVTKTGQPSDALFCRIAHVLTMGRHKDPAQTKLPLDLVFSELPNVDEVRLNFFAVFLSNQPLPPEWANKPGIQSTGPQDSKLRVVWSREEKIVPYLSYSISRGEWKTLGGTLRAAGHLTIEDFQGKYCGNVLKVAPNLRANFKDIQVALTQARSGEAAK